MKYAKPEWRDGQPYSNEFDDVYFSSSGGVEETEHVFIQHNDLVDRFSQLDKASFVVAETGFGSGLNFLVCVEHWLQQSQSHQSLHFYSVENRPFRLEDLKQAQKSWPQFSDISQQLQQQYQVACQGFHQFELYAGRVYLTLMAGEVETMLEQAEIKVDAWMLDGFAPGRNPDMWSDQVFSHISRLSHAGTTFSTYTSAGSVKRGLKSVGFEVNKVAATGNKRDMLSGVYRGSEASPSSQPWFDYQPVAFSSKKVCVIGAGIAGLTSAFSLLKRGYQVELVEMAGEPGAGASGNPRGMIMPRLSLQDSADAEFYLTAYFHALRSLRAMDPEQLNWQQTGGIQLPATERIRKQIVEYTGDDAVVEVLSAELASQRLGLNIDTEVHYFPQAACVSPQKILNRLLELMSESLSIRYNTTVSDIEYRDQQWRLLDSQDHLITSSECVIVANAWQSKRFASLQHLHLNPARGQLSLLKSSERSEQLKIPLAYDGYLMPDQQGVHVAGASFVVDDCDNEIRQQEHQVNIDNVNREFAKLFNMQDIQGGRASVRAVTSDRMPAVGPVPDVSCYQQDYGDLYKGKPAERYPRASYLPGLFVNTGHGARGFTSAFLSAELVSAMIADEPLPVSNRVRYALHPARFLIRQLKKKRQ